MIPTQADVIEQALALRPQFNPMAGLVATVEHKYGMEHKAAKRLVNDLVHRRVIEIEWTEEPRITGKWAQRVPRR